MDGAHAAPAGGAGRLRSGLPFACGCRRRPWPPAAPPSTAAWGARRRRSAVDGGRLPLGGHGHAFLRGAAQREWRVPLGLRARRVDGEARRRPIDGDAPRVARAEAREAARHDDLDLVVAVREVRAQSSVRPPSARARPVTSVPSTRQRAPPIASALPVTAKTSRFAFAAPIRSPWPGPAAARSGASARGPKATIAAKSATIRTPATGPFPSPRFFFAGGSPSSPSDLPCALELSLEAVDLVEEQRDRACGCARVGVVAPFGDVARPAPQLSPSGLVHSGVSWRKPSATLHAARRGSSVGRARG